MNDPSDHAKALASKNKRLGIKLGIGVVAMFGFAYLMVPLYSLVCKQTGINGKVYQAKEDPHVKIDYSRTIHVVFSSSVHGGLHMAFKPLIRQITIHPGETKEIYFFSQNKTGRFITVQAVPSITPGEAAKYLKKTQCFCFTQQSFVKNEKVDMPVIFHLDPDIPKYIQSISLNYTMFDADRFNKHQPQLQKGWIHLEKTPAKAVEKVTKK